MSTFTSTVSYSGTIISANHQKARLPKRNVRALSAKTFTSVATYLISKLKSVSSGSSEKFYQEHVNAIFICLFLETAMGPLVGSLGIYLFAHWIM